MNLDTYDIIKNAVEKAFNKDGYRYESGDYVVAIDRGKVINIVELNEEPGDDYIHRLPLLENDKEES